MPLFPSVTSLQVMAATPVAGFTLVNGTSGILSWTAPSDLLLHRVIILAVLEVTSAATGGQLSVVFTSPAANAHTVTALAASQTQGVHDLTTSTFYIQSGTSVTLNQSTALTAGAAALWAEIWGS
jgi:hypothetical protein